MWISTSERLDSLPQNQNDFRWRVSVAFKEKPTVKYWLLIHKYEELILIFIRSQIKRENELAGLVCTYLPELSKLNFRNQQRSWKFSFQLPRVWSKSSLNLNSHHYNSPLIDQTHGQANNRNWGRPELSTGCHNAILAAYSYLLWIQAGHELDKFTNRRLNNLKKLKQYVY